MGSTFQAIVLRWFDIYVYILFFSFQRMNLFWCVPYIFSFLFEYFLRLVPAHFFRLVLPGTAGASLISQGEKILEKLSLLPRDPGAFRGSRDSQGLPGAPGTLKGFQGQELQRLPGKGTPGTQGQGLSRIGTPGAPRDRDFQGSTPKTSLFSLWHQ